MREQRRQIDIVAIASAEQGHTTAAGGTRCQQSCCQMFAVAGVKQPVVASSFIRVAFVRGHRRSDALADADVAGVPTGLAGTAFRLDICEQGNA